jgi:hypothetical protein
VRNLCLRTKPAKPAKAQPHAAEPTDHTVEGTTPINARARAHKSQLTARSCDATPARLCSVGHRQADRRPVLGVVCHGGVHPPTHSPLPTSAPGLGSPLPTSAPGLGSPLPTSAPGLGADEATSPQVHHRLPRRHRRGRAAGCAADAQRVPRRIVGDRWRRVHGGRFGADACVRGGGVQAPRRGAHWQVAMHTARGRAAQRDPEGSAHAPGMRLFGSLVAAKPKLRSSLARCAPMQRAACTWRIRRPRYSRRAPPSHVVSDLATWRTYCVPCVTR